MVPEFGCEFFEDGGVAEGVGEYESGGLDTG